MACGSERVKGIILTYSWRTVTVTPIEIVGLRGRKVQYKIDSNMESEAADNVHVFDTGVLAEARKLQKEHEAWKKRWEALLEKSRKIDPDSLK
jgi:FtsZ-binding cell division protein ZapB